MEIVTALSSGNEVNCQLDEKYAGAKKEIDWIAAQAIKINRRFRSFNRPDSSAAALPKLYFHLMHSKFLGTLTALLLACQTIFSQAIPDSPYQFDWKKDASALTVGAGLSLTAFLIEHNLEPRTALEVENADFDDFLGMDKTATKHFSRSAEEASDWMIRISTVSALSLFLDKNIRQDAGKIAVLSSETFLITYGLTNLAKVTVKRNRPFVFNDDVPLEKKLAPSSQLSFFSGHTSTAAATTFFTAKVWSDYHPDSKWKPVVWTAAAAVPAVTGYLRVKAGKHYPTDVATGYLVGALTGYLVPHFHKIKRGEKRKLRLSTSMIDEVPVFNVKYRF